MADYADCHKKPSERAADLHDMQLLLAQEHSELPGMACRTSAQWPMQLAWLAAVEVLSRVCRRVPYEL